MKAFSVCSEFLWFGYGRFFFEFTSYIRVFLRAAVHIMCRSERNFRSLDEKTVQFFHQCMPSDPKLKLPLQI